MPPMSEDLELPSKHTLPVLPLRDIVVFPNMIVPLFVGRKKSVDALEDVMKRDQRILLVTQKDALVEDPKSKDLYQMGTVGQVLQLLKLPDGTVKILVEGEQRAHIFKMSSTSPFLVADIEVIEEEASEEISELEAMMRTSVNLFEQYLKLNPKLSPEILASVSKIEEPNHLADTITSHLSVKVEDKQKVLEITSIKDRLEIVCGIMEGEISVLQAEKRIRNRVKSQMEKSQREYYLNEQMKAIQKELGDSGDSASDYEEFDSKLKALKLPKEVREKAETELRKFKVMNPMSSEATVVRNYLDWIVSIPWNKRTRVKKDIESAEEILNEQHYGLEKVKERILEYLAVQTRVGKVKGPILCLVGPPGVGKTSLGESIAQATGRKFVRMALGGVRDEAEIRGHRRTYIGSMPGKIIQGMKKAGSSNPLFLLDEVDKLGADWRGDPSSALLEVLDPEQNTSFNDHYLEVDYDLSDVMFVTTANSLDMPQPLLDRMEIIRLSGYTEEEKIQIALRHLVPKQMERHGLKKSEWSITEAAIRDIIRYYTHEAGVRSLERSIAKLMRKGIREILTHRKKNSKQAISVTEKNLDHYLGVKQYKFGISEEKDMIGTCTGLAYTTTGGDILFIEAVMVPGKGKMTITGKLGDVMQESVQAAVSFVRSKSTEFGVIPTIFEKNDIHVHVPEGATPKDGPSAGIAICTSIISMLTGIPVRRDVAMTGEITLRGRVLPIGGLKEKLLAAHRGGIKKVLIPKENEKDLKELPENLKANLKIVTVDSVEEVIKHALVKMPKPISWTPPVDPGTKDTSSDQLIAH